MKLFLFVAFLAVCLAQESVRAWPPLKNPSPPEPEPLPPSRCDAPVCGGLQVYLQPTHEPTQFFQCTLFGRFVVASCPLGLSFSYTQQTCVLPSRWENQC